MATQIIGLTLTITLPTLSSVQENFDLITSFIQESVEKHIPPKKKTSRSTSSVPWITLEIRRMFCKRNRSHA